MNLNPKSKIHSYGLAGFTEADKVATVNELIEEINLLRFVIADMMGDPARTKYQLTAQDAKRCLGDEYCHRLLDNPMPRYINPPDES